MWIQRGGGAAACGADSGSTYLWPTSDLVALFTVCDNKNTYSVYTSDINPNGSCGRRAASRSIVGWARGISIGKRADCVSGSKAGGGGHKSLKSRPVLCPGTI